MKYAITAVICATILSAGIIVASKIESEADRFYLEKGDRWLYVFDKKMGDLYKMDGDNYIKRTLGAIK